LITYIDLSQTTTGLRRKGSQGTGKKKEDGPIMKELVGLIVWMTL